VDVWVRRCASFEEEQRAEAMTPAARIEALEELRELWRTSTGDAHEGLRRTVRVLQPPGR
jgi:hypothetical protein